MRKIFTKKWNLLVCGWIMLVLCESRNSFAENSFAKNISFFARWENKLFWQYMIVMSQNIPFSTFFNRQKTGNSNKQQSISIIFIKQNNKELNQGSKTKNKKLICTAVKSGIRFTKSKVVTLEMLARKSSDWQFFF